jgi:hypothetical protein
VLRSRGTSRVPRGHHVIHPLNLPIHHRPEQLLYQAYICITKSPNSTSLSLIPKDIPESRKDKADTGPPLAFLAVQPPKRLRNPSVHRSPECSARRYLAASRATEACANGPQSNPAMRRSISAILLLLWSRSLVVHEPLSWAEEGNSFRVQLSETGGAVFVAERSKRCALRL